MTSPTTNAHTPPHPTPYPTTLDNFNVATEEQALALISHWCAAPAWAQQVCQNRPFKDLQSLVACTQTTWNKASHADCLSAFSAHPVIGDVELLRAKYASQANKEQGQVLTASDAVLSALAAQNIEYKERHGFTFIVFATGKSAQQMLQILNGRIGNSTRQELDNASAEQLKIMQLRIEQSFAHSSDAT